MIVSGLFLNDGMVIVLVSMKMVVGIVYGFGDNLILWVVDVMIKE